MNALHICHIFNPSSYYRQANQATLTYKLFAILKNDSSGN